MARPRDYQKECIRALANARAEGKKKALVVMASGLGKTLTAIFDVKNYLEANPAARVLMLCHSADILRQTKEVFKTEFGDEYSYGLYNGQEKACRKTDFLFANLQSVDLHREDFDPQDFDYIIVDEAHHSAAPTYGRSIEYFEPDFILGLTATPDRMDGQKLDQFFGDEPVYSKDLVEAIKEGLLSDIDYYVEIDEENRQRIRKMIGEDTNITYADIDGLATNNYTANEDVVAKIREQLAKMSEPTAVIFCQTIEHADAIHALMPGESAIVYSKYDSVTNNENIAKFRRGDIKTIITINMFNEGIDIPRTDVVVFLRVTQSKTIFLQQLGRGLRKAENKEKVVVMDFVGTGARIRQIMDFEGQFSTASKENKKPGAGNSKGGPGYGYFNLHLGGHESYEDVAIKLVEIIKISRHQTFYDWDNLSREEIWEDLAERFKSFRIANGRKVGKYDLGNGDLPSMYFIKGHLGDNICLIDILEKAYNDTRIRWTKEKVDNALREMYIECGDRPGQKWRRLYAKEHPGRCPSEETLHKFYPSWDDAYDTLDLPVVKKKTAEFFPKDKVFYFLSIAVSECGRIPTLTWYSRNFIPKHPDAPRYDAVRKYASDKKWRTAFFELGVVRIGDGFDDTVTKEDAKTALEMAESEMGSPLSRQRYISFLKLHPDENFPSISVISSVVLGCSTGRWNDIKTALGIKIRKQYGGLKPKK